MFFIKNKVLLMECRGCISHPSDPLTHGINDSIKLLHVSACQVHFVLNSSQDHGTDRHKPACSGDKNI